MKNALEIYDAWNCFMVIFKEAYISKLYYLKGITACDA